MRSWVTSSDRPPRRQDVRPRIASPLRLPSRLSEYGEPLDAAYPARVGSPQGRSSGRSSIQRSHDATESVSCKKVVVVVGQPRPRLPRLPLGVPARPCIRPKPVSPGRHQGGETRNDAGLASNLVHRRPRTAHPRPRQRLDGNAHPRGGARSQPGRRLTATRALAEAPIGQGVHRGECGRQLA